MSQAPVQYEVLGTITEYGELGQGLRLVMSTDGASLAVVRASADTASAELVRGPWETERLRRLAENVLAGEPRALTWPPALMALAAFTASQFLLAERVLRERSTAPALQGSTGSGPSEPTPPEVPPAAAANAAVRTGEGGGVAQSSQTFRAHEHEGQPSLFGARTFQCNECGG